MEIKIWHRGEINPLTGLQFWAYQDKAHTTEQWYTPDKFIIRDNLQREYQRSRYVSYYKERRYIPNKIELNQRQRKRWNERISEDPIMMLLYSVKRNARNRKLEIKITKKDIENLILSQEGKCYYSGLPLLIAWKTNNPYQLSIDRVNSKLGYTLDNIVLCCQAINFAKSDYSIEVFKDFIKNIASQFRQMPSDDEIKKWAYNETHKNICGDYEKGIAVGREEGAKWCRDYKKPTEK